MGTKTTAIAIVGFWYMRTGDLRVYPHYSSPTVVAFRTAANAEGIGTWGAKPMDLEVSGLAYLSGPKEAPGVSLVQVACLQDWKQFRELSFGSRSRGKATVIDAWDRFECRVKSFAIVGLSAFSAMGLWPAPLNRYQDE